MNHDRLDRLTGTVVGLVCSSHYYIRILFLARGPIVAFLVCNCSWLGQFRFWLMFWGCFDGCFGFVLRLFWICLGVVLEFVLGLFLWVLFFFGGGVEVVLGLF